MCNTHVSQGVTPGEDRASRLQPQAGGSSPEQTRDVCQGGNSVSKWLWLEHECVNRADERLQQTWTEQHHLISSEK